MELVSQEPQQYAVRKKASITGQVSHIGQQNVSLEIGMIPPVHTTNVTGVQGESWLVAADVQRCYEAFH